MMGIRRLHSLLRAEERLLEADYFAGRLRRLSGEAFGYELNAFLSAARCVSFVIHKEMEHVGDFAEWWKIGPQRQLGADPAAQFFKTLRNFSQKEGRVSLVGTGLGRTGRQWSYRFAGNNDRVPAELLHRDVADCCVEHVSKLAAIILSCAEAFPYHACSRRALTPEGITTLGLSTEDVEEMLGFPRGWTNTREATSSSERLRVLREYVDGVDFDTIRQICSRSRKKRRKAVSTAKAFSEEITRSLVQQLEAPRGASTS